MTVTNQDRIIDLILAERKKQDKKWGSQPRNRAPSVYVPVLGEEFGEVCRAVLEGDSENYAVELIQLAATALTALEDYFAGRPVVELNDCVKAVEYPSGSKGLSVVFSQPSIDVEAFYTSIISATNSPEKHDALSFQIMTTPKV